MKQFLLGILSFTFADSLILLPLLIMLFACFSEKAFYIKSFSFVLGILFCYVLPFNFSYFVGAVLIFVGLKFSGFFKQKKKLSDNSFFKESFLAFILGGFFYTFLLTERNFLYVSGLSLPFFLIACAFCGMGVYFKKAKNLCGLILIFYGALFPILKFFGVV